MGELPRYLGSLLRSSRTIRPIDPIYYYLVKELALGELTGRSFAVRLDNQGREGNWHDLADNGE